MMIGRTGRTVRYGSFHVDRVKKNVAHLKLHYKKTPFQIYRKLHLQKTEKKNLIKKTLIVFIILLKT